MLRIFRVLVIAFSIAIFIMIIRTSVASAVINCHVYARGPRSIPSHPFRTRGYGDIVCSGREQIIQATVCQEYLNKYGWFLPRKTCRRWVVHNRRELGVPYGFMNPSRILVIRRRNVVRTYLIALVSGAAPKVFVGKPVVFL